MKLIGGQAVVEGVLMKSDDKLAIAVRLPNGEIKIKKENLKSRSKFWKAPFIRGVTVLLDTLYLGMKALFWSTDQQLDEHEKIRKRDIIGALFVSFTFAVLFFILLPLFLAGLFVENGIVFNLVDGLFRVIVLFAYIIIISRMSDVKTIFQYHGAEHMAVHAYEAKKNLSLKNVKEFSTIHPRCGTAFLMIVLAVSIIVFSFITFPSIWYKLLARIVLIPVVSSFSYEILKLSNRFKRSLKFFLLPGLLFQKITTKKPSDKQLEVAIKALEAVS